MRFGELRVAVAAATGPHYLGERRRWIDVVMRPMTIRATWRALAWVDGLRFSLRAAVHNRVDLRVGSRMALPAGPADLRRMKHGPPIGGPIDGVRAVAIGTCRGDGPFGPCGASGVRAELIRLQVPFMAATARLNLFRLHDGRLRVHGREHRVHVSLMTIQAA